VKDAELPAYSSQLSNAKTKYKQSYIDFIKTKGLSLQTKNQQQLEANIIYEDSTLEKVKQVIERNPYMDMQIHNLFAKKNRKQQNAFSIMQPSDEHKQRVFKNITDIFFGGIGIQSSVLEHIKNSN
jgi:hypothetical protein